jgi:hypothetical protein
MRATPGLGLNGKELYACTTPCHRGTGELYGLHRPKVSERILRMVRFPH